MSFNPSAELKARNVYWNLEQFKSRICACNRNIMHGAVLRPGEDRGAPNPAIQAVCPAG
jgi:hypothetical protein